VKEFSTLKIMDLFMEQNLAAVKLGRKFSMVDKKVPLSTTPSTTTSVTSISRATVTILSNSFETKSHLRATAKNSI
jgi:hypothetical protein